MCFKNKISTGPERAGVAQPGQQRSTHNRKVAGSNPASGTRKFYNPRRGIKKQSLGLRVYRLEQNFTLQYKHSTPGYLFQMLLVATLNRVQIIVDPF